MRSVTSVSSTRSSRLYRQRVAAHDQAAAAGRCVTEGEPPGAFTAELLLIDVILRFPNGPNIAILPATAGHPDNRPRERMLYSPDN